MLCFTRNEGEAIMIGNTGICVRVLYVKGKQVKVGIDAPRHIPVHREEIYHKIKAELNANIEQEIL